MSYKSSRNLIAFLCLALPTIALTSCTVTTTKSSPSPSPVASVPAASPATTSMASAAPAASPAAANPGKTIKLSVVNNSGKELTAVYFSPPDKKTWGLNEIDGQKVPDREKADFEWNQADYKGTESGCVFDVRSEYGDGTSTELDGVDICKESAINFK